MHHLVGFSGAPGSAAMTNLAGLADQMMNVSGNNVFMTSPILNLVGAYARGAHITRGQLFSPSLNRIYPLEIQPVDVSATPQQPSRFTDLRSSPFMLEDEEPLSALVIDATGAEVADAFAWLADGPIAPVTSGEILTARATGTTTLVAAAWTAVPLTFVTVLPSGRYQIVGLRAQSAGCVAARVVIPGQEWRPGVIGCTAASDLGQPLIFRYGNFGDFGTFKNTTPPQIEFYSLSADTSEIVGLDLIYLGR